MKKVFNNKNGSMMLEYFIILSVGIVLLGAFTSFLDEGDKLLKNSVRKVKKMETTDRNGLGSFE